MAGKPKGARNADYEEKRLALVRRIRSLFLAEPTRQLSVREIAAGCGVSVPTLNHYFDSRRGMVYAVLEQSWLDAEEHIDRSRKPKGSLQACIERELATFLEAFTRFGLDRLHIWGMTEGLADEESGPAYLRFFLEPTLQAAEAWLACYQESGEIPEAVNLRYAAIALYSPCLVLFMHQESLGGRSVRPADIPDFIKAHGEQFAGYLAAAR